MCYLYRSIGCGTVSNAIPWTVDRTRIIACFNQDRGSHPPPIVPLTKNFPKDAQDELHRRKNPWPGFGPPYHGIPSSNFSFGHHVMELRVARITHSNRVYPRAKKSLIHLKHMPCLHIIQLFLRRILSNLDNPIALTLADNVQTPDDTLHRSCILLGVIKVRGGEEALCRATVKAGKNAL